MGAAHRDSAACRARCRPRALGTRDAEGSNRPETRAAPGSCPQAGRRPVRRPCHQLSFQEATSPTDGGWVPGGCAPTSARGLTPTGRPGGCTPLGAKTPARSPSSWSLRLKHNDARSQVIGTLIKDPVRRCRLCGGFLRSPGSHHHAPRGRLVQALGHGGPVRHAPCAAGRGSRQGGIPDGRSRPSVFPSTSLARTGGPSPYVRMSSWNSKTYRSAW